MKKIRNLLKDDGFVFIHTAPSRLFNDNTYKFWCYPVRTLLMKINKFFLEMIIRIFLNLRIVELSPIKLCTLMSLIIFPYAGFFKRQVLEEVFIQPI